MHTLEWSHSSTSRRRTTECVRESESFDAAGFAIVADALGHPGPAVRTRIPLTTCAHPFQPGVDPPRFAAVLRRPARVRSSRAGNAADVPEEPPLRPYVVARR